MSLRFQDIELGDELPEHRPDIRLEIVREFAGAARMDAAARFTDHDKAREEGLPGAIVPGIMSQGILAAMVHGWSGDGIIERIDTVFRAMVVADTEPICRGVVTDVDPGTRTIVVDLTMQNEAHETTVLGTATVRFSV